MAKLKTALAAVDRFLGTALKWLTIALFAALTVLLSANIFVRFVPVISLHWFDEIVELLYAALVFYGAAAVWINKGHFTVGDWISGRIRSRSGRHLYRLLLEAACLAFALVFLKYSLQLTAGALELTPVFGISRKVHYSCMPVSAVLMAVYSLKNVLVELARALEKEHREA
jgi:TRAP-type transport system small permease protein